MRNTDAYDGLKNRMLEKEEEIREFLDISNGVFFYDELQNIIKYNIASDDIIHALSEIFDRDFIAINIQIHKLWDDYIGFFQVESDFSISSCERMIKEHYS